jgi:hypothetical protein
MSRATGPLEDAARELDAVWRKHQPRTGDPYQDRGMTEAVAFAMRLGFYCGARAAVDGAGVLGPGLVNREIAEFFENLPAAERELRRLARVGGV